MPRCGKKLGRRRPKKKKTSAKISVIENEIENASQSRAGGDGRVAKMREDAKACRDDVFLLQSECARMENKISKAQMELDATIDRLWDEYQLTYTTAQEVKTEMPSVFRSKKAYCGAKGRN